MANVVFSAALLRQMREALCDLAVTGQYYSAGSWRTGTDLTAAVQSNGAVHITFMMPRVGSVASAFRILDKNNNALISRTENVTFAEGVDEMLYRFKIAVG